MEIGDLITYRGALYYLRGLEPMSVPDRRVDLELPSTGERVTARLAEVEPASPEEHAGRPGFRPTPLG